MRLLRNISLARAVSVVVTHVYNLVIPQVLLALILRNYRAGTASCCGGPSYCFVEVLTPGMATNISLSTSFNRSRLTFPNHSYRSGGCGCNAYKQIPAYLGHTCLQTSRRDAHELRNKARPRLSAAVAEQDIAHEGVENTSQVQTFLQWLAIQGCAL